MKFKHFIAPFALVCGLIGMKSASAEDVWRWYINEYVCKSIKITVLSYCRDEGKSGSNSLCSEQILNAHRPDSASFRRNLLAHEPYRGDFHVASSLRCGVGNDANPYLFIILDNGGNCDNCEISGVLSLVDGRWKHYGRRWYVKGKERADIDRREYQWFKHEAFYLENKVVDKIGPTK